MKKPQYIFEVEYWLYMDLKRDYFATLEDATRFALAHNKANPLGAEEYDPNAFSKIEVHKLVDKEALIRIEQQANKKQSIEIIDDKAS